MIAQRNACERDEKRRQYLRDIDTLVHNTETSYGRHPSNFLENVTVYHTEIVPLHCSIVS